jgi:ADP-ribose pyrophosphatase YjhB (NUDIX family)
MLKRVVQRSSFVFGARRYSKNLLVGEKDVFNGLTIDITKAPQHVKDDPTEFHSALKQTLETHKKEGTRGVWMRIPRESSKLIPVAIDLGFDFHHTELHYIMLTHWLPSEPNHLPRAPQHFVGTGGAVVDLEKRQILLVTEKTEYFPGDKNVDYWKIPGGQLDNPDETIPECAEREVFEETGVYAQFEAVLSFRHLHNFRFAKSDLYFVCVLKPKHAEINHDPREISKCKWIPLDEYFAMTHLRSVQLAAMKCVKAWVEDPSKCLKDYDVSPKPTHKGRMYVV